MTNTTKSRLSRRTILTGLVLGAGGAGAAAFAGLARSVSKASDGPDGSWWSGRRVALERAGATTWRARVGTVFSVQSEAGEAVFRLAKVDAFPSPGERPDDVSRDSAFLLVFEGDRKVEGGRIYNVRHDEGAFDIFFDPADPDSERSKLQAVFN